VGAKPGNPDALRGLEDSNACVGDLFDGNDPTEFIVTVLTPLDGVIDADEFRSNQEFRIPVLFLFWEVSFKMASTDGGDCNGESANREEFKDQVKSGN